MVIIANFACLTFISWNFKGIISNLLIWYVKLPQYSFKGTSVSDDYDSDLEERFSDFKKRCRQI
jgi:hypothetical protein